VKITDSTLKPELFLYSASAARKAGFKASGHIPMALTVEQAVDAGLASIEHLDYAFKAGSKDEAQIAADFGAGRIDRAEANRRLDASFDRDTAMHAYRDFAKRGVFVTPTLNGGRILDFLTRMTTPTIRTWPTSALACARPTSGAWTVQPRPRRADQRATRSTTRWPRCCRCCRRRGDDHRRHRCGLPQFVQLPGHRAAPGTAAVREGRPDRAAGAVGRTRSGPAWFGQMDRYGGVAQARPPIWCC
jgi:hypothetical protein